ncbi:MAG: acyl-CoA dehydrogenase family protein [Firmicutes bacterium]|nr:acyl-CoA dehydrogenase family protein [Bacillota bacterium]
MDFNLTAEQRLLQETVRKFAQHDVAPLAATIDREAAFPTENFKKMGAMGLLGITVPSAYGGGGGSYLDMMIVAEELGVACQATALAFGTNATLFNDNVLRNGSEVLKHKYLPGACAGDLVAGLAMTEPDTGSDVVSMQTKATRQGDGYVLDGTKIFITNAPIGDVFIVYAKTEPSRGAEGISAFVVEATFPGFRRGRAFEKMGWRGSPTGELVLDHCRIPEENLLGELNRGVAVLMSGLNSERLVMGALSVGLARGAYEFALQYAQDRRQFGQPLVAFQLIQDKLVAMAMHIEMARLLVYKGAALMDQGIRGREANLLASYAKLFASEMCMTATTEAVQILGGYGFTKDFSVERMMRDAKIHTIGGGTSEIQKIIIMRQLLASR